MFDNELNNEVLDTVFKCRRHGSRTEDQVYRSNDKSTRLGFRYKCKECTYLATHNRPCKVHGDIPTEDRLNSGKCRICEITKFHAWNHKRNNNREEFNERQKLKREANPEKYLKQNKKKYQDGVAKYGAQYLNDLSISRAKGISIEKYRQMFIDQNNLCAICNQPETRIFKYKDESKGIKVARLCLDHNHETGKIRQLLCHDCNTSLGKFKDNIQTLQAAIDYLKRHE